MRGDQEHECREHGFGYVYFDVRDPVTAWMVYRGVISSSDTAPHPYMLSWFQTRTLSRAASLTIEREGKLEGYRHAHHPELLSRMKSLFAFPDIKSALDSAESGHFLPKYLAEIFPKTAGYRREEFRKEWIDNFSALGDAAIEGYWSQDLDGPGPREMLLSGTFYIFGTKLRNMAKQTIWNLGKGPRLALEISRIAGILGSDMGMIYPTLSETDDGAEIRYLIRWDDKICADLVDRATREIPAHELDLEALHPLRQSKLERDPELFKMPDLRPNRKIRLSSLEAYKLAAQSGVEIKPRD